MEEGRFLENLPPEEKKRLAYIEGREDLFRTKVFEIEKEESSVLDKEKKNIVVESRDPGGANALMPVLKLLQKDRSMGIKVITDGRAQEILQENLKTKDITPQGNILEAAGIIGSPDVSLIGISEEGGIEMFVSATFPEVPSVLVEDYYGSSLGYLKFARDKKIPYPKKICVIDEEAKKIITKRFPELEDAIEVTGQPAFDRFAHEDTERVAGEVKKDLGIKPEEKLVTFMSAMDKMELVQKIAEELAKVKGGFKFAFRIHPRDNTPIEDFEKEFRDKGIDCVETMKMTTERIGAASDLVITTTSTEGLHAICRGKPSINIVDSRFVEQSEDLTPPPSVKLGASIGLDRIEGLAVCVEKLLNPRSNENKNLKKNMKKHYPVDGKNAKRVVEVLKSVLNT